MKTRMSKILPLLLAVAAGLMRTPVRAEMVFLNDGNILEGKLVSESDTSVTLRIDETKKNKYIPRGKIIRILYSKAFMGKVFVQKTDGKGEHCYLVEEDRESYTFRRELNSPEEFSLKRDKVLFLSRGNPSGLSGEPGGDTVKLSWYPSYNQVRKYHIYLRKAGEENYPKVAETREKVYTVTGLAGRTKYQARVTAIDFIGEESLPTNEFDFTTKNIPPPRPDEVSESRLSEEIGKFGLKLSWSAAESTVGRVAGYNIYRVDGSRETSVGRTASTEIDIRGLPSRRVFTFSVKAVDDLNDETVEGASITVMGKFIPSVEARYAYIMPFGDMGKLYGSGFGAIASLYLDNVSMYFFDAGVSLGLYAMEGKYGSVKSGYIIPLTLTARYRMQIAWRLSFVPSLDIGYTCNYTSYSVQTASVSQSHSEWALNPLLQFGGSVSLDLGDIIRVMSGVSYGVIFEKSAYQKMLMLNAGLEYKF